MTESTIVREHSQLDVFFSSLPYQKPENLILDGNVHRFGEGQKGREPHWYVGAQTDDGISFTVGSHKFGDKYSLKSKKNFWPKESSFSEKWAQSSGNLNTSMYLHRKCIIGLFGTRISPYGNLVVPMMNFDGDIVGLQTIKDSGEKRFVKGSRKKCSFFELTGAVDTSKIMVCEGFATAASVMMSTGTRVFCAFDSGNLPLVTAEIAKRNPEAQIFVAGDDDRFSELNAGRKSAEKVAKYASAIFPKFSTDNGNPTDWNDLHVREGLGAVKSQLQASQTEDFPIIAPPPPLKNLRKIGTRMISGREIESKTPPCKDLFVLPGLLLGHVGLLCSPGGAGKSGLSLLLANQIACGGQRDFIGLGERIPGSVVLLSLEDPLDIFNARQQEIRKDLSADEYLAFDRNLHFMDATDMQSQMSANFVISSVKEVLDKKPESGPLRLIIIDHLSYWSNRDLNDGGQCTEIIKELNHIAQSLNCAVLVLHHTNRNALIKGKDRQTGSVNIGGSYKLHSLARWVAVLEHVEKNELKRVHKIEGNDEDYRLFLLDKVNHGEKIKVLLKMRPERMGLLYKVGFSDKKLEAKKEVVQAEIVSREEAENFNMVSTSTALSTLDYNTHHILRWLTQNPAFETVSLKRRGELTEVVNCEHRDKNRESPSVYENAWVNGDVLIVDGPLCDQEDMRLFALLINELTRFHRNGGRGLSLELSLSQILRLQGIEITGTAFNKVQRQLDRLRRMSLDFKNTQGHRWRGPFINDVISVGEGRSCKVRIGFNQFIITFYKIQEYTLFKKQIAESLKGQSLSFYLFFASLQEKEIKIPIEKCKKLLGIKADYDKKEAVKRVKKAVEDLIEAGVMDPSRTAVKNSMVHAFLQ